MELNGINQRKIMAKKYSSTMSAVRGGSITAVLGPTNTGKTHLAIERLIGHETGMIGLPLRLLAREVYNRIEESVGSENVALVTGEEKIVPSDPRYWVSTVEAMPLGIDVDFVAVDEVQLAADLERGHVFTHRILNARGAHETLLLGADTIRPILEKLLPGLNIVSRPRMSTLTFSGSKKITRLPPRSAVVAFSSNEVYEIAELLRRQRGGAAVVLGSLSPRTRNAQVQLFQSGEVDILVATDAIGMGLNLDVNHVAFAGLKKFDGRLYRDLTPAEIAQIAGRAGRHMQDGTFGVSGQVSHLDQKLVEQVESHEFEPLKVVQWRNTDLDYSSLELLYKSLNVPPTKDGLTRVPIAQDVLSLDMLTKEENIADIANSEERIRLLWEVCQIPDYTKIAPANHAELAGTIFTHLVEHGSVPEDWMKTQVSFADRTDGDIDTLANRIAHVRTWTYVANRADWLDNKAHWQEQTRTIENRLSDALHEQLIQRFVDKRTSVLQKSLRENSQLESEITNDGEVIVEDQHIGFLRGFKFESGESGKSAEKKAVRAAALQTLAKEFEKRAENYSIAPDEEFQLSADGSLRWLGEPIAKLIAGDSILLPKYVLIADEHLTGDSLEKVNLRTAAWIRNHFESTLQPLFHLKNEDELNGLAKGMAYRLVENLGIIDRRTIAEEVRQLDQTLRATLRKFGVRFGEFSVYIPSLLKPAQIQLLALLRALNQEDFPEQGLVEIPQLSAAGRTTIPVDPKIDQKLYNALGFRKCGKFAIRIDILERLANLIRPLIAWKADQENPNPPIGAVEGGGGFTVTPEITSLLGCSGESLASILVSLGYESEVRELPDTGTGNLGKEGENSGNETKAQDDSENQADSVPASEIQESSESTAKIQNKPDTGDSPDIDSDGKLNENQPAKLEIWRPVRRKNRKITGKSQESVSKGIKSENKQGKRSKGQFAQDKNGNAKDGRNGNRIRFHGRARKSNPKIDSPFASLASLKEQMEKGTENSNREKIGN